MAKHPRTNPRLNRHRRSGTPSAPINVKQTSSTDSKRQHVKKQQAQNQKKRRSMVLAKAALRLKRERWSAIALETQNIVLGDGKYVEERPVPSVAPTVTQPSVGQEPGRATTSVPHNIAASITLSTQRTTFYEHHSKLLGPWESARPFTPCPSTQIEFSHKSTLNVARQLVLSRSSELAKPADIGVLAFASAKRNDAYLHGSSEQEDAIKRASTLSASLASAAADLFYKVHRTFRNEDGSGLQDHAMLYCPGVIVLRKDCDDDLPPDESSAPLTRKQRDALGGQFIAPYAMNVVTAVPVNAAAVRAKHVILPGEEELFEDGIRASMKDRMGRILRAFEINGDKALVLGAFGCSSFENKVETVASIWAELLECGETVGDTRKEARFKNSFEKVVFAVPGKLHDPFKRAYDFRVMEQRLTNATLDN